MRRICTYVLLVCLGVVISVTSHVNAATITDFIVPIDFKFTKPMSLGANTSPDVAYLQNLLNMSTSTRVAETGSGSNYELTSYYGDKTKDALGRFQQIFAVDIAYEKSISTSTATSTAISSTTVDVFTRAILNKLLIVYKDDREWYIKSLTATTPQPAQVEEVPEEAPEEAPAPEASAPPKASDSSATRTTKNESFTYKTEKNVFTYSPQGQLLKAIGGNALVDKVYSYTPMGQLGKLTGSDGGSSQGSGNNGKGMAAAGGALGISALAGGGGAAAGGAAASKAAKPLNFGGPSVAMVTCTCSSNLLITVQDVRGVTLPLIYQPGVTVLYKMYQPRAGVNMLGQYVGGGVCLVYAGTSCVTGGTAVGTMIQLGTSAAISPKK